MPRGQIMRVIHRLCESGHSLHADRGGKVREWATRKCANGPCSGRGVQAMPITVYYATNRNETGTAAKPSFGPNFHAKGPHYLRFGSADVDPPSKPGGDYKVKSVYLAPENLPGAASKSKKVVFGSREIFEEL